MMLQNANQALHAFRANLVSNRAGGLVHPMPPEHLLDRVLLLGTFDNTYYASGATLTLEALQRLSDFVAANGRYVVDRTVEISQAGRAPSNDPALMVMAFAMSIGDDETKAYAAQRLPLVARTGTHLMTFLEFATQLRGWGRLLKKAAANWFLSFSARNLAYQAIKYQNRGNWSLRRALCNAHVATKDPVRNNVFNWIVRGWKWVGPEPHPDEALQQLWAYEHIKRLPASDVDAAIRLIVDYRLPREAVPTHFLSNKKVWEALFFDMPMSALLRNLATLTRLGVLEPLSETTTEAIRRLTDPTRVEKARLHPIKIAVAQATYTSGRSTRNQHTWTPIPSIAAALDEAFELSFPNVEPTGKKILIAIDVSGSMSAPALDSMGRLAPRDIAGLMAYVIVRTEPDYHVVAFDTQVYLGKKAIQLRPSMSRSDVIRYMSTFNGGGTDVSAPVRWAYDNKIHADAIVVLTDNETWANTKPVSWYVDNYRQHIKPDAAFIANGMVANHYSVFDANDVRSLNITGVDTHVPLLINQFVRGFDAIAKAGNGSEEEEEE